MLRERLLIFSLLILGSGAATFWISQKSAREPEKKERPVITRRISTPRTAPPRDPARPLLLDPRPLEQMDSTHYEVTVSEEDLIELGQRIERDSRERLRELTDRYQLTANQRREAFPLLVSHHADFSEGLIVNGFAPPEPGLRDLASELYEILDLHQQEIYQEDLVADQEWWAEIINQLRDDLEIAEAE